MPLPQKYLVEHGITYTENYCTVSLLCPSRVSMCNGKHAHNINVTDLSPPYGKLNMEQIRVWVGGGGKEADCGLAGGHKVLVDNIELIRGSSSILASISWEQHILRRQIQGEPLDQHLQGAVRSWVDCFNFLLDLFTYQ